jgi:hypothetical protein
VTLILPDEKRDPWEWWQFDPRVEEIMAAETLADLDRHAMALHADTMRHLSPQSVTRRGEPVRKWCDETKSYLPHKWPDWIMQIRRAIAARRSELAAEGGRAGGAHPPHQHESKQHV